MRHFTYGSASAILYGVRLPQHDVIVTLPPIGKWRDTLWTHSKAFSILSVVWVLLFCFDKNTLLKALYSEFTWYQLNWLYISQNSLRWISQNRQGPQTHFSMVWKASTSILHFEDHYRSLSALPFLEVKFVNLTRPRDTKLFGPILFWVFLWVCFR
jgi:hypothetical protein